MAQLTTGLRAILSHPLVYDLFQDIAGATKFRRDYVSEYVRPIPGERVLDIGCGTAAILDFLPRGIDFVGLDSSPQYLDSARARFGDRARFYCQRVDQIDIAETGLFDVVMANGLLHHLSDEEVGKLCSFVAKTMKPGGRMITHDPCYSSDQSLVARYIISRDRGQNVRNAEQYAALLRPTFATIESSVRHDMARFPYTHAIMVCRK